MLVRHDEAGCFIRIQNAPRRDITRNSLVYLLQENSFCPHFTLDIRIATDYSAIILSQSRILRKDRDSKNTPKGLQIIQQFLRKKVFLDQMATTANVVPKKTRFWPTKYLTRLSLSQNIKF